MFRLEVQDEVTKTMRRLTKDQLPTALRNTVNDTARDVMRREEKEIQSVFHKPVRILRRPFDFAYGTAIVDNKVKKTYTGKATKENPIANIVIKEDYGKRGKALNRALQPHIPGYPSAREEKGMEYHLRRAGLMTESQYLVPSKTMRLDKHGNVTGGTASKMLNDLGVLDDGGRAGFTSTTRESKVKYVWRDVRTRGGKRISGIFYYRRKGRMKYGDLKMVVVDTQPTYKRTKVFEFKRVAEKHAAQVMPKHARLAVEHAIRRASR